MGCCAVRPSAARGFPPVPDHLLTTRLAGTRSGELSARCYSPHYPDAQLPSPLRVRRTIDFSAALSGVNRRCRRRSALSRVSRGSNDPSSCRSPGNACRRTGGRGYLLACGWAASCKSSVSASCSTANSTGIPPSPSFHHSSRALTNAAFCPGLSSTGRVAPTASKLSRSLDDSCVCCSRAMSA